MRRVLNWFPNLWSNPITLLGTVLTTLSAFAIILLLGLDVSGLTLNPYTGVLLLVGLPGLFVFGLLLIPGGLLLYRKRRRENPPKPLGEAVGALFATPQGRRKLYIVGALTIVNGIIVAVSTQRLVAWTSDSTFCGTACHGIMEPEWETYHDHPHANVACVQCHVGPGAGHAIRAKMDGLRQVWQALNDSYERPVPAPVHSMRPSRETCEQCHWSEQWHGDRLSLYSHTFPDETNTERVNVMRLKLGGRDPHSGKASGIHWHAASDTEVRYEAYDAKRTKIGKVTVLRAGAVVKEFLPPAAASGEAAQAATAVETRRMDCIDCHNRPTHRFDASPTSALDRAFESGRLDRGVKWLREIAGGVLAGTAHKRSGVEADFRKELEAAYKSAHSDAVPEGAALDAAAKGLASVWRDDIFPDRGVAWGTYPSHAGHQTDPAALYGCFRCHDDKHKTSSGEKLSGECEVCHEMLAQDEKRAELEEPLRALFTSK